MDKRKIGRDFEKECIPILNILFDKVEWLADKNLKSAYDFKCERNGKSYNVEAKYLSSPNNKPRLTYTQSNVDLVICKKDGEIFIYDKSTLLDNVIFSVKDIKHEPISFNHPTIRIQDADFPVQIKKRGSSKIIVLPTEFLKYMKLDVGDWVDVSDIVKANGKDRK